LKLYRDAVINTVDAAYTSHLKWRATDLPKSVRGTL